MEEPSTDKKTQDIYGETDKTSTSMPSGTEETDTHVPDDVADVSDTESFVDAMEELTVQSEHPVDFTDSSSCSNSNVPQNGAPLCSRQSDNDVEVKNVTVDCDINTTERADTCPHAPPSDGKLSEDDDDSEDEGCEDEGCEDAVDEMIKEAISADNVEHPDGEGDGNDDEDDETIDEEAMKEREANMSEEEKQAKKDEAQARKAVGNDCFKSGNYTGALEAYTDALMICPLCYSKERSIMYSNRAASKYKMERLESAIEDCTKALELHPTYLKALLRRAELYEKTDKLEDALADYTKSLEIDASLIQARAACQTLPGRIEERNEKMKQEMMGKLKDLGNMILRPFGLSTNNFKMQQDPNTGSYSMQFQQGAAATPEPTNGK